MNLILMFEEHILDFEWIRNQMVLRYPLRLILPVMKERVMKTIANIITLYDELQ